MEIVADFDSAAADAVAVVGAAAVLVVVPEEMTKAEEESFRSVAFASKYAAVASSCGGEVMASCHWEETFVRPRA